MEWFFSLLPGTAWASIWFVGTVCIFISLVREQQQKDHIPSDAIAGILFGTVFWPFLLGFVIMMSPLILICLILWGIHEGLDRLLMEPARKKKREEKGY